MSLFMSKYLRNLGQLKEVTQSIAIALVILACSGSGLQAQQLDVTRPLIVTYSKDAGSIEGDHDQRQLIRFSVPIEFSEKFYFQVFDADTGGKHDETVGIASNTEMRFSLYGRNSDALVVRSGDGTPTENIRGRPLQSIKIGSDKSYDDTWRNLFVVDPSRGQIVGEKREFFILIAGTSGDDGNLMNVRISRDENELAEIEGSRIYSFLPTVRARSRRSITQLSVNVPEDTGSLTIENFDSAKGTVTFAGPFRSLPLEASGQDEWEIETVALTDQERGARVALSLGVGVERRNDASIYISDDKGRPVAIELPPKGFRVNKRPVIELEQRPKSCTLVQFDASNAFDPDDRKSADTLSYRWHFHDGSQKSGAIVEHEFSSPGTFPARLEVFDNSGQIGNGTLQDFDVFVKAVPVAEIEAPDLVGQHEEFILSGFPSKVSHNQPDAEFERYNWAVRSDGNDQNRETIFSRTTAKTQYTFANNGQFVVSLTVTDNSGHPCDSASTSKVIIVNAAPIAEAGEGQTIALGTDLNLSAAESSDADGDSLSFQWDLYDGNLIGAQEVRHVYERAGTYDVKLTVDDNKGASNSIATDNITIIVNAAPTPVISAQDQMLTGVPAEFDAGKSIDDDGTIISYEWRLSDGTVVNKPNFRHTFFEAGTYQVTLIVEDDTGIENSIQSSTKSINVSDPENSAPIAVAGDDRRSIVDQIVSFDGGGSSDEDGTILSYEWDFGDGQTARGLEVTHVYRLQGTYNGTLTVTDNVEKPNSASTDDFTVVVSLRPNAPAVAQAVLAREAFVSETVSFDASGTNDTDGSLLSYHWDFGDGFQATGVKALHAFEEPGTYRVVLSVTDDSGSGNEQSEAIYEVVVTHAPNKGPVANLPEGFELDRGELFRFNASSAIDPDGNIIGYDWDFGDGFTSKDMWVDHAFSKVGTYTGKLRLTDNSGFETGTTESTFIIYVQEPENTPPEANAGLDRTTIIEEIFELSGSASRDEDGSIIRYEWDLGNGKTAEGEKIKFSYFEPGNYRVTLKVTDSSGQANATARDEIEITVIDKENATPVAMVNPDRVAAIDEIVPFSGKNSEDRDGNIISYDWDFGDGNSANGRDVEHAYAQSGRYEARLTIRDDSGLESAVSDTKRLIVVNEPPFADAGSDQHVTASVVEFSASRSSDQDSKIIRYSWNFGDGQTGEGREIKHTYREPGDYLVGLEIEDDSGAIRNIDTDQTKVRVNSLPIADAGFDIVAEPGETLTFDGRRSEDSDGAIDRYIWDFKDENSSEDSVVRHAFENPGVYYVELTVFDDSGHANAFDISSVQVIINAEPVAMAGADILVAPGEAFELNGGDSYDLDGEVSQWQWDFSGGLESSNQSVLTAAFAAPGIYTATLTVSDGSIAGNNTAQDSLQIFVNHGPIAEAGKDIFADQLQIVLDGSASTDADNDGLTYHWELGDGNAAYGAKIRHTYEDGGIYPIVLTIDDGKGLSNSVSQDSMTVEINRPPVAIAGNSQNVCVGDTVVFDASASRDPDNGPIRFDWDFGNGQKDNVINPTRVYENPGVYHVNLTVEDDSGLANNRHRDSLLISVKEAPKADAGDDILACANAIVQFDGRKSTDIDGVVNRFTWQFGDNASGGGDQPRHTYSVAGTYRAALTIVGDTDGQCSPTSRDEILVEIVNAPRGVIEARSKIAKGEWIDFDASNSYADEAKISQYLWKFGDGKTASGPKVRHLFKDAGVYRVTLDVHAPDLAAACQDNQSVHIVTVNEAPSADAGEDRKVGVDRVLQLSAAASSDRDGGLVSYGWDFGDGTKASGIDASHIWRDAGVYTVRLTVTDDSGMLNSKDSTEIKVEVLPVPEPEIVTSQAACVSDRHEFGLVNISPDLDTSSLIWNFGDGTTATGAASHHRYSRAGIFSVTVHGIANQSGLETPLFISKTIKVNNPPVPVPGGYRMACPGVPVQFDGSRSFDKDGNISSHAWNFGDGTTGRGEQVSHSFKNPGTYVVELTVTDESVSACAATTERLEVFVNAPPVANAGGSFKAKTGGARDRVTFDASGSSDADGDGLYYYWVLSSGEEFDGEKPSHVFTKPGNYTAELVAEDPHGLACSVSSDTIEINVESHGNF